MRSYQNPDALTGAPRMRKISTPTPSLPPQRGRSVRLVTEVRVGGGSIFVLNGLVLLFVSIFMLVFTSLATAEDYQSLHPDSPYKKIMESIKKGQQPPAQKQPPQSPVQPLPLPPQPPTHAIPSIPAKQPASPSLKGKNIKANLELTVSARGSASDSSSSQDRTSVSSHQSSDSVQSRIEGKVNISLAFEEVPAFPHIAQSPTVLVPVGTFTYYLDRTKTAKGKWSEWQKGPLGDAIVHPQNKESRGQGSYDDESITHCEGGKVYEGVVYQTHTQPAVPSLKVPQQAVKTLGLVPVLHLQEEPNGTMTYSINLDPAGQCKEKEVHRSSNRADSYSKEHVSPGDYFPLEIKGTFSKGQKTVPIKPGNVDHRFPEKVEAGNKSQPTNIVITGNLSFISEPGKLQVTPGDGLASSGPDDNDRFVPQSKAYILKNGGESPINYRVSKTQSWLQLSGAEGSLNPNQTAEVKVLVNEETAKSLKQGDYKDTVTFTNTTNSRADTTRPAALSVGEEQTWRVLLSGQETDDIGGNLMYMKVKDKWGYQVVEYGVRFDYKVTAEFTLKKKEGKWKYKNGKITSASVKPTPVFDPKIFFVNDKKTVCKNCQKVNALAGTSLSGDLNGDAVRLVWPRVIANVVVYNRLKIETTSVDEPRVETLKGYSANEFFSECFFDYACTHNLTLKDGELPPIAKHRRSAVDQYRQKSKQPIQVYHRYVMKRIR